MTRDTADGFLARWSRRKRAAAPGPTAAPVAGAGTPPEAGALGTTAADPLSLREAGREDVWTPGAGSLRPVEALQPLADQPLPDPAGFDLANLPTPETLTAASDITAFLRAEVPAALRRAALRRIWTLDPGIRDFIGPADYAWDYNAVDGVPGFALQLGGDAEKLLAQAMGWQTEADATGAEPADQGLADQGLADQALADQQAVCPMPEAAPSAMVSAPEADRPDAAKPAALPAEADVAMLSLPRRHGSATPS